MGGLSFPQRRASGRPGFKEGSWNRASRSMGGLQSMRIEFLECATLTDGQTSGVQILDSVAFFENADFGMCNPHKESDTAFPFPCEG